MSGLEAYLDRPMTPPDAGVLAAAAGDPIAPSQALALAHVARLLDPAPLPAETGWCVLEDGVGYVAVRTPMPGVTADMIDWWFDWHPDDPLRYRIWHPPAHISNAVDRPAVPGAKRHHGTVHHPVEDVGTGAERIRIAFHAPEAMGLTGDDRAVATIVCGDVGDERRRMWHTTMVHVWLQEPGGVVLRSRFWLGAALRPFGPLGVLGAAVNRPVVRRRAMPSGLPRALGVHCAEEYANLAALLPELHGEYAKC